MRRTEAPTGSSRHQEQGHKGKEAKGGQGFTRVCTHAHHHPHQTQRTPERDRKKKKKRQNVYLTVSRRLLVVACGI